MKRKRETQLEKERKKDDEGAGTANVGLMAPGIQDCITQKKWQTKCRVYNIEQEVMF